VTDFKSFKSRYSVLLGLLLISTDSGFFLWRINKNRGCMFTNFKRSLFLVLKHEGGYVDHPKDPGGATNLGITLRVLAAYRKKDVKSFPKTEVKNLKRDEAAKIYKINYWDRAWGDKLPVGVDYCVFDYAVNSGVSRATKNLQRIVDSKVDGVIGLNTISKVHEYGSSTKIITIMCNRRLSWLHRLKHWITFGRGWEVRVNNVKTEAIKMAMANPKNKTVLAKAKLKTKPKTKNEEKTIKEMAIEMGLWGI